MISNNPNKKSAFDIITDIYYLNAKLENKINKIGLKKDVQKAIHKIRRQLIKNIIKELLEIKKEEYEHESEESEYEYE